ncbi:acyltransferase-like protein [Sphingomonas sp. PP-CE-3A-406]|uniref:acyltransferase family protein n=1 Tax=Sphingomonas sp. PP-CE-3A-406 TaxID=2135659 RepID=UPI000EF9776E|nr:acyltransferase [Sphingomonas sp. PP-CE-3A-406]RMB51419.1 acyltransferase-like protein [Sphingomonas sp. PP-CE-3A-406]
MTRHYGMDWLRIGAFALLILYHIGMVFVPWNFHVKSLHVEDWVRLPMLASNAWRLTLLFVVSGYASRALLARSRGVGGFFANRCSRLLVPLLFGIVVIVPPQPWVELVTKHAYAGSYWMFWSHDYFRFDTLAGLSLPTWNHLWFVVYLWAYTAVLTLGLIVVRGDWLQRAFDRVFGGWGALVLPVAWLIFVHAWWFQMAAETQELVGDWVAHVTYFPAFLFGFGLARSEAAMAAIARWWKPGAVAAVLGYVFIITVELHWPGDIEAPRWVYMPYGVAHALEQWGAIIALIGIAERHWNRDHRWRPVLTEAVFPFYLIHQTIIVLVMYALLPAGLPGWAEFACLLVATTIGCIAFYVIGRSIAPLRPLIGLRALPSKD